MYLVLLLMQVPSDHKVEIVPNSGHVSGSCMALG
jgi:hypothetical protein